MTMDLPKVSLAVNTSSLENILQVISQTLKGHDEAIVSNLPKVDDLRKDINRIRLELEDIKRRIVVDDDDNKDDVIAANNDGPAAAVSTTTEQDNITEKDNSYGLRQADADPINLKHAESSTNATDQAITSSLCEIKSAIRKLQQDRDEGLINSMEVDEGIKSLKDDLFDIQHKLASSASVEQLQSLQTQTLQKYEQSEQRLQDFRSSFQIEIDGSINKNLAQVKSCFTDLEALVKQRQSKLEQRVASCAKEYDVSAFRESIESSVASLMRKVSFLDDTAKAQGKTLVMLQQKNAISMFHRNYSNWKKQQLEAGLSRWKQVVKHQKQYEEGKEIQKRRVRKIL